MSLLKWVVKNNSTGQYKVLSPSGKIPIGVFDFAINECYKFIKQAEHEGKHIPSHRRANLVAACLAHLQVKKIIHFYVILKIANTTKLQV